MPVHIKSISEFAQIAQQPGPRHPLIGIVNISNIQQDGDFLPKRFSCGFYTIGLKIYLKGYMKYGRTHYDFQEGELVFTASYQVLSSGHLFWGESRGWYLLFVVAFESGRHPIWYDNRHIITYSYFMPMGMTHWWYIFCL